LWRGKRYAKNPVIRGERKEKRAARQREQDKYARWRAARTERGGVAGEEEDSDAVAGRSPFEHALSSTRFHPYSRGFSGDDSDADAADRPFLRGFSGDDADHADAADHADEEAPVEDAAARDSERHEPAVAAGRGRKRAAVVSVAPRASKRQRVLTEKAADAQLSRDRGRAFGGGDEGECEVF
jgi:hypothetical protein